MVSAPSFFSYNERPKLPRVLRGVTTQLAWVVLALSLGLTVLAYCTARSRHQHDSVNSIPAEAFQTVAAIKARLDMSAQTLNSAAALLMLNRTVQPKIWQQYQQNLSRQGWPTGMVQLGYAQRITSTERGALNTAMRADSVQPFQIHPASDHSTQAPVLFIAPEDAKSGIGRPGFDLLAAPILRQALRQATDTGAVAFHSIRVQNDSSETEVATASAARHPIATHALMVLPLFLNNAVPPTVNSRREQVVGYVFALLDIGDVLHGIDVKQFRPVQLIASTDHDIGNGLGQSIYGTSATHSIPLDLFGNPWLARVIGSPAATNDTSGANVIAIIGTIFSLLLFAVLRLLASITRVNYAYSKRAFQEICQLQNQLSTLIGSSGHAIMMIDHRQRIMLFNKSAELLFGVASETAVNMTLSRYLPHRLKGARRLDASRNFGARLSTYRLHNVTHEFAVRHNGEHFPFEATIFKNGQRGKCTYLILLKDLTTTEANSTADARRAGPISQRDSPDIPADSAHRFNADTRASHFELVVSDSVCDATFAWLGTIASQENLAAPQTLSMAHPFPSLTQNIQQITIKEFINNYIHIDDRAAVKHQWKNALRSGSDVDCVYRLILSDGSVQLVRHWMAQTMKNDTARHFEGVLHKIEHTTAPAPSINMLPANDTDQPAQHDERRRSQPSDTEAGRLYQQLQCRIMTFESAREAQQKHLAREMHDDFGQLLTAMKMDLIVLQGQLNKVDHRLSQQLGDVSNLVDAMVISVRRIIANLPPQTIGQHGLVRSLELMTEAHTKRHRIPCRLQIQPQLPELDDVIVMPIYRIVQEALNNVAKHARATEIDICIMQHEETLHLSISDNGTGITETALRNPGGFGLISMRERIVTLNGKMAIDTTPGSGTTIRVVIPIDLEMAS